MGNFYINLTASSAERERVVEIPQTLGLHAFVAPNALPGDDPGVVEALKANNLIEAITRYRMTTNASLEEAKSAIEQMRGRLGIIDQ